MKEAKETTKIESRNEELTCGLRWRKGVLQQEWKVQERIGVYSDGWYQYDNYRDRTEWRKVPGTIIK